MKKIALGVRIVLGLIFFVFGLNGFLNFIPQPAGLPEAATSYMGALFATGYFFPVLKVTEILCGAALLSGYFVPLALVILAPITIQIFLFHFMLTPGMWAMALAILCLHAFLGWQYLPAYKTLLQPKTKI